MLRTGRFCRFAERLVELWNEEETEKTMWEYWLHKDFERSYAEFRNELASKAKPVTEGQVLAIIRQSREIAALPAAV